MPADHRDRTRRHTDQRPQIKNRGQSDTNKVLQNDKHGADSYQLQNAESAFFQHTQAGRITNAGKNIVIKIPAAMYPASNAKSLRSS